MLGKISACLLAFLVVGSSSLYTSTSNVVKLTSKNFKNTVLESNELWFV